jgi:outer membrane protein
VAISRLVLPIYRNEFDYLTRTVRLDIVQPIFRGGALNAGIRAAEAQVAVQQAQLIASEQSLLNSAGIACADLILSAGALKLVEEYEAALRRARDGVTLMVQRQDMTITDKAQAETRLASARAQVSQAQAQAHSARFAFQTIVGRLPDGIPAPISLPLPVRTEEEALQAALEVNPTIVAARYALAAAEAGTDVAFGNWLPSIDLAAGISDAREANAGTIRERDRDLTVQISLPIFAGGAHVSQVRQADHLVAQRRFDLEDSTSAVTAAVRQAWQGVLTADSVLAARRLQVEAAVRSLDGVKMQFGRGNRSFLDTLNALQESITARNNLLGAERSRTLAQLQLLGTIGGLTARGLQLPVPLYDPAEHLRGVYRSWFDIGE